MNGKISIIIPIYNTGKYIRKCLDSVTNQTYKDIEIILINDGSTDESSLISKEYAQKDKRIILIEKENEGAATARNTGIKLATGDYIGWVDSDDYVELDMFEKMLDCLYRVNADACICQLYVHEKNQITTNPNGACLYEKSWFDNKEYMEQLLPDKIKSYLTVHLIKRELYTNIQFPDGKIVEDAAVLPYIMEHAKRIAIFPYPKYHYVIRSGSETTTWQRKRKGRIARANIFIDRTDYARLHGYHGNCFDECLKIAVEYSDISYLNILSFYKTEDIQEKNIRQFMIRYQTEIKNNPYLSLYKKYIADCIKREKRGILRLFKLIHYIKGLTNKKH